MHCAACFFGLCMPVSSAFLCGQTKLGSVVHLMVLALHASLRPYFGVDPGKKHILFLGRSSYNRNPEPTKKY